MREILLAELVPGHNGHQCVRFDWGGESVWASCPYRLVGRVWRKLRNDASSTTLLVPLWVSATWWTLLVPDAIHFVEAVVDWVWLPRMDPTLFMPGVGPGGRDINYPARLATYGGPG